MIGETELVDRTTAAWTMGIGLGLALSLGLGLEHRAADDTADAMPLGPHSGCKHDAVNGLDVLMTLQTRDHEVTVYSSIDGPRFTVAVAGSGAVLAEQLDGQAFEASFPGLHQHLRRALADDDQPSHWAGL